MAANKASRSQGQIIILNGFPGVGKLTILEALYRTLPPATTRLLVNHLLIDPVTALFPHRGPEHHALRRQLRQLFFEKIKQLASQGLTILMTACLAEADTECFGEYLDIVEGTDIKLLWVTLHCDLETMVNRVASAERLNSSKSKLTDPTVLRQLVRDNRLIEPTSRHLARGNVVFGILDTNQSVKRTVDRLQAWLGGESSGCTGSNEHGRRVPNGGRPGFL